MREAIALTSIIDGTSWLATDEKFDFIKGIFSKDKLVFKRMDLTNTNATKSLVVTMKEQGLVINTVFLSNVREYAESDGNLQYFQQAVMNLADVMTPKSLVIDTKPRKNGIHEVEVLTQRRFRDLHKFLKNIDEILPASPR